MTTQLLQVQFQGVDEGLDPKALPPGTMLKAENCAMDKARRLVKRAGTAGLVKTTTAGGTIAAGARLLTNGVDTGVLDGAKAYNYAAPISLWQAIDRPPCLHATKRTLLDSTRSIAAVDIAIYGDMIVSVYQEAGTGAVYWQVDVLSTGASLVPPTGFTTNGANNPRVLVSGTSAYIFAAVSLGIQVQELSLTTLQLQGLLPTVLAVTGVAPSMFDVVIGTSASGTTLYLAYDLTGGGASDVTLKSFVLSTFVAVGTVSYTGTSVVSICLAYGALSSRILLIYSETSGTTTRLVSTTVNLGAVAGPTTILTSAVVPNTVFIAEDTATNALVGVQRNASTASTAEQLTTTLYSIAAHVAVAASNRITYGLFFPSKPWRTGGRWYTAAIAYVHPGTAGTADAAPSESSVVVDLWTAASGGAQDGFQDGPHLHVATLENQTGRGAPVAIYTSAPTLGYVAKTAVSASGDVYVAAAYRNRESLHWYMDVPVGWSLFKLTTGGDGLDLYRPTTLGAGALLAGAAPAWYDGAAVQPYGFAHAPCIISISDTGAGAMAAGSYSYVATFMWRDANGVVHRSTPSGPLTGTAGASRALTVVVSTTTLSNKMHVDNYAPGGGLNPVMIELWRTTVGGTGPHYRLSLNPLYQVLNNDLSVASVSLVDTKADANIGAGSNTAVLSAQEQLYTDAGELANVPPPPFTTVTTHRNRFAGIDASEFVVWLSKDATSDMTQAPGFNEALTLSFATKKKALGSLDTTLIVYGEDDIDIIQGDGPDDTGAGTGWQIQPVQSDVGCINPRSVVTCPAGNLFLSRRGLELIDRGLTITWIGRVIDDTLALFPNITSAVLVAEQTEVRWTLDDGETGLVLVWDYENKCWFTRVYNDASDTDADSIRFVDASLIDGVYTLLTAGGQVYRETTAHKLDGGLTYVERDIILAPISPSGNLAWHRVKDLTVMGTSVTNHDLEVSVAHDYSATYGYTKRFLAGDDVTATGPLEKCRVSPAVQKCQAVQIRIRDLAPSTYAVTTGDGPILEALALRVGVKSGPAKTAAGQQG